MTVDEARKRGVCRICGDLDSPRRITPTLIDTFVVNYGEEYAHSSCLGKPLTEVWPGFPRLMLDGVDQEGNLRVKPQCTSEDN